MTNEEFERLKDSIRANLRNEVRVDEPDEKEVAARRKLDRDMDRLERVLKRYVGPDPRARQMRREEDERWREFERNHKERLAEISAIAARSDQKLKALLNDIRKRPKQA